MSVNSRSARQHSAKLLASAPPGNPRRASCAASWGVVLLRSSACVTVRRYCGYAGHTIAGVEAAGEKSSSSAAVTSFFGRHRRMVVGWKRTILGEHRGPRKTRQDSSSLGCAARRLTLSRYVARLKPRCGSLALSVMWSVLTVSQVGAMARFE